MPIKSRDLLSGLRVPNHDMSKGAPVFLVVAESDPFFIPRQRHRPWRGEIRSIAVVDRVQHTSAGKIPKPQALTEGGNQPVLAGRHEHIVAEIRSARIIQ